MKSTNRNKLNNNKFVKIYRFLLQEMNFIKPEAQSIRRKKYKAFAKKLYIPLIQNSLVENWKPAREERSFEKDSGTGILRWIRSFNTI